MQALTPQILEKACGITFPNCLSQFDLILHRVFQQCLYYLTLHKDLQWGFNAASVLFSLL